MRSSRTSSTKSGLDESGRKSAGCQQASESLRIGKTWFSMWSSMERTISRRSAVMEWRTWCWEGKEEWKREERERTEEGG